MDISDSTKDKMDKAREALLQDLKTIRTGRAAPSLVENIMIEAYEGQKLKVMELATITSPDVQTLVITPFDGSIIDNIRKGIAESNTGLNPVVDGQIIRINIPQLSEERRQELIKFMRQKLESARIMIRQIRHEAMAEIKKQQLPEDETSRLEKEIQKLTDENIEKIEELGKSKEEELLTI